MYKSDSCDLCVYIYTICIYIHKCMYVCICICIHVNVCHHYSRVPGHRNHRNDPASEFLSTHWWRQYAACQRCFYQTLRICHLSQRVSTPPGARGKRRGFRPRAAARHSQSARVHTEISAKTAFFIFFWGEPVLVSLNYLGQFWPNLQKSGCVRLHPIFGINNELSRLNPIFGKKLGWAGSTRRFQKNS